MQPAWRRDSCHSTLHPARDVHSRRERRHMGTCSRAPVYCHPPQQQPRFSTIGALHCYKHLFPALFPCTPMHEALTLLGHSCLLRFCSLCHHSLSSFLVATHSPATQHEPPKAARTKVPHVQPAEIQLGTHSSGVLPGVSAAGARWPNHIHVTRGLPITPLLSYTQRTAIEWS